MTNTDALATAVHAVHAADANHAAALKTGNTREILAAFLVCLRATRALAVDCGEDVTELDYQIEDVIADLNK